MSWEHHMPSAECGDTEEKKPKTQPPIPAGGSMVARGVGRGGTCQDTSNTIQRPVVRRLVERHAP